MSAQMERDITNRIYIFEISGNFLRERIKLPDLPHFDSVYGVVIVCAIWVGFITAFWPTQ